MPRKVRYTLDQYRFNDGSSSPESKVLGIWINPSRWGSRPKVDPDDLDAPQFKILETSSGKYRYDFVRGSVQVEVEGEWKATDPIQGGRLRLVEQSDALIFGFWEKETENGQRTTVAALESGVWKELKDIDDFGPDFFQTDGLMMFPNNSDNSVFLIVDDKLMESPLRSTTHRACGNGGIYYIKGVRQILHLCENRLNIAKIDAKVWSEIPNAISPGEIVVASQLTLNEKLAFFVAKKDGGVITALSFFDYSSGEVKKVPLSGLFESCAFNSENIPACDDFIWSERTGEFIPDSSSRILTAKRRRLQGSQLGLGGQAGEHFFHLADSRVHSPNVPMSSESSEMEVISKGYSIFDIDGYDFPPDITAVLEEEPNLILQTGSEKFQFEGSGFKRLRQSFSTHVPSSGILVNQGKYATYLIGKSHIQLLGENSSAKNLFELPQGQETSDFFQYLPPGDNPRFFVGPDRSIWFFDIFSSRFEHSLYVHRMTKNEIVRMAVPKAVGTGCSSVNLDGTVLKCLTKGFDEVELDIASPKPQIDVKPSDFISLRTSDEERLLKHLRTEKAEIFLVGKENFGVWSKCRYFFRSISGRVQEAKSLEFPQSDFLDCSVAFFLKEGKVNIIRGNIIHEFDGEFWSEAIRLPEGLLDISAKVVARFFDGTYVVQSEDRYFVLQRD